MRTLLPDQAGGVGWLTMLRPHPQPRAILAWWSTSRQAREQLNRANRTVLAKFGMRPLTGDLLTCEAPDADQLTLRWHGRHLELIAPGAAGRIELFYNVAQGATRPHVQAILDAMRSEQAALLVYLDADGSTGPQLIDRMIGLGAATGGTVTIEQPAPAAARNAPCPCGSARKYKRCHGA